MLKGIAPLPRNTKIQFADHRKIERKGVLLGFAIAKSGWLLLRQTAVGKMESAPSRPRGEPRAVASAMMTLTSNLVILVWDTWQCIMGLRKLEGVSSPVRVFHAEIAVKRK